MAENSDLPQLDATLASSLISSLISEAASTQQAASTQPRPDRPPWQPFIVPAWPLERQQDLVSEQSKLLHEHFVHFGKGLERLHEMVERVWEDLSLERQQRRRGEEQGALALADLREDLVRKQELVLKHVDECLVSVRTEMLLRTGACDDESQRLRSCVEGLAADINAQLAGALQKQIAFGDELRLEMHSSLNDEHAWCENSLKALSGQLMASLEDEVRQRAQACLRLEGRLEEECLAGLHKESARLEALSNLGRKEHEGLEATLNDVKELVLSRIESVRVSLSTETRGHMEVVNQCIGQNHEHCINVLRDEECRRVAGDEALRICTQNTAELFVGRLATTEETLSGKLSSFQAESVRDAEALASQLSAVNAVQQQLLTELSMEQQQRSVSTLGLVSELREVRGEFASEARAQEEAAARLSECTQQTSCLQGAMQQAESAHAALSDAFLQQTSELRKKTSELNVSLETTISDGLKSVADSAKLCNEELWHVVGSVQDRNAQAAEEMQDLGVRTERIEVYRLGEISGQLEEVASQHGETSAKLGTLEHTSLVQEAALTSRLDDCTYGLGKTREIVDGLVASATKDFLESPNSQFRLYLTPEGDVAVHSRKNWGKWASNDFQGVPCWHAGCQPINDRPLCSVNREMQGHEKDRFLALANREVPIPVLRQGDVGRMA